MFETVSYSIEFTQGKMDAAASMIQKAIVANPTYAEAYNNLGIYLSPLFIGTLCVRRMCFWLLLVLV